MQFDSPNIKEYVRSFQYGEEKGFTYFFNALYKRLLVYASRFIKDRQMAEELVGESFIKVWKNHTSLDHEGVIKSYLYTTVHNTCIDYLRSKEASVKRNIDFYEHVETNDTTEPVIHEMIRAEVIGELYDAIDRLPTAVQRVYKMSYIQGKTVKEIAEELGIALNTVKNHKARGLVLLRNIMTRPSFVLFMAYYADRIQS
ncbi:MAG: RNA polymerase sigma-70 factor [Bacteroidota bacterium]